MDVEHIRCDLVYQPSDVGTFPIRVLVDIPLPGDGKLINREARISTGWVALSVRPLGRNHKRHVHAAPDERTFSSTVAVICASVVHT